MYNKSVLFYSLSTIITGLLSVCFLIKGKGYFFTKSDRSSEKLLKLQLITKNSFRKIYQTSLILFSTCLVTPIFAQSITQSVRGKVFDIITQEPLPFATIVVLNTDPVIGSVADSDGNFVLEKVPVGRRNVRISLLGYEGYLVSELLVSSGKEVLLNIGLQKAAIELAGIVVKGSKDVPLNSMTTLSARQFTSEETQRYAGGMDDPARLASSFAGVSTSSSSCNGISVRGNNPDGLLWRIEGVEVPSPNHFANLKIAGGGLLTAISSQLMGNSDFYTGAFPAEYGNASSGVFDIKLSSGNSSKRQYTIQAGIIGVDLSTQGPFCKGGKATYNMNYRNSTMALVSPLLPANTGVLKYQDLSFKMNFPTLKTGIVSIWGIGALDGNDMQAADSTEWKSDSDRDNSQLSLYMFASGLSHKISLNSKTFVNTTLSVSGNGLSFNEQRLDDQLQPNPQAKAENNSLRYTFQSYVNKRFGEKHSNRTGFSYSYLGYNIDVAQSISEGIAPITLANQEGHSGLMQIYSQSKIELSPQLTLNLGVNAQYFMLNKNYSIEPRAGIKYSFNDNQSLAFAYGLHSRIEQLPVYFVKEGNDNPNKNLKLMKSAHYVLAYNLKLNPNLRMSIEPYYQRLTNIPVARDGFVSTLNSINSLFFDESLVSKGTGRNVGVDVTLERFLSKGYYYLVTASVFDSKYKAVDGVLRNTRFNKNYVFNINAGKEWVVGKNNILGANIRLNYLGGNRKEPIDEQSSIQNKKVVYGETNGKLAYAEKYADTPIVSFTISYRKNKPKYSSVWSFQAMNVTGVKEYSGDFYNLKTGKTDTEYTGISIPNLSYKIEF